MYYKYSSRPLHRAIQSYSVRNMLIFYTLTLLIILKDISTVLLIRALDFTYRHPIDYHRHNANKRSRRTIITAYIKKVIFAAFIFCIPKFFESKIVAKTEEVEVSDPINDSNKMVIKQTGVWCRFSWQFSKSFEYILKHICYVLNHSLHFKHLDVVIKLHIYFFN